MTVEKSTLNQAVILCGGLGTRLRPLTDSLPKPMVLVNDRPFLHHLLEQLAQQGIAEFILLTGYLGEKISNYFGDGSKFGWSISYSTGPTEWDTGRRVWEARAKLDRQFLLLYSDNFVQFNLSKLVRLHEELSTSISLLLAPKLKGNIRVSEGGRIHAYDKHRSSAGFDFVEVGYMVVERDEVLQDFPNYSDFPNFSFSEVLERLAQKQKMAGLVVRDSYHSISDPERLALMSNYLLPKKILLIDRDGTLNEKAPRGEYITQWDKFRFVPETVEALKILSRDGFKFIVITNQAGIARHIIDPKLLEEIHRNMIFELSDVGVELLKVYMCPDHWEGNSLMRKPAPGMFFQAAKEFNLRMDQCVYAGDDERDCLAAANAGCSSIYIGDARDLESLSEEAKPLGAFTSLLAAVPCIENFYNGWCK